MTSIMTTIGRYSLLTVAAAMLAATSFAFAGEACKSGDKCDKDQHAKACASCEKCKESCKECCKTAEDCKACCGEKAKDEKAKS